jgi:predicted transcriptional regulator
MSGKIIDGATLRRSRLIDLIQQILRRDGMTSFACQSYMMLAYGLKWETTSNYLRELTLAQVIAEKDGKWVIRELPKDLF